MAKKPGYQFPVDTFIIQPGAVCVGPVNFDLSPQLEVGDVITSITVTSYLRRQETTTDLIDTTLVAPSILGNIVSLYLKDPGAALKGRHKLTFTYTIAAKGMTDSADFMGVETIQV